MAFVNGVARGIVMNSGDPTGGGRVQVQLPSVPGEVSWAQSCSNNLRVGDLVVVAFENGDTNRPVVLGKILG